MTAAADVTAPTWTQLLEAQDGVLARRQALRSGLSAAGWEWRLERQLWQLVLPGVAVAHVGPVSWRQRAWAAVLYGGDGAALSGDAVVRLISDRGEEPTRMDVVLPEACQRARHDFFVPHRCSGVEALLHPARQPPQLRIAPAVLHSSAWAVSDKAAEWRLAAPVQRRLVRPADLQKALVLMPRLRRRRLMTVVLKDVVRGAHAGSELDFLGLLRRQQLPLPDRLQLLVRTTGRCYLDAWWERPRVAAELDGAHHMEVGHWDADTLRGNDIVVGQRLDRVVLLRFTTGNLRHDEEAVARQLRAVLL
ncbi:MAG: hypothetical protein ACR2K2_05535 [Mycobacteriales bacterium]